LALTAYDFRAVREHQPPVNPIAVPSYRLEEPPVFHPAQFSIAYATYFAAGAACLAAIGAVLVWLVLTQVTRGASSWTLFRQELIWTLVPALVLVGLTVIGEIPQGWGRVVADGAHMRGVVAVVVAPAGPPNGAATP
jgi:hypothetical protein